jgi:hypothetical protein
MGSKRRLPQMAEGSASVAQALLTLRPAGSLSRPTGDPCHEAPTHAVTRTSRSSATGSIDKFPGRFFLH